MSLLSPDENYTRCNRYSEGIAVQWRQHIVAISAEAMTSGGPASIEFHQTECPEMEKSIPILPADDLKVAKEFYVDGLGFRVAFEVTDDGKNGLLGLERGGLSLTIDSPMSGHGREACASLQVESADAYYNEWRERVAIERQPKNESWGARTFDVIDPFGNTIFVMGPIA